MEQHPVPQNVTTFQFRLIGDMTIKQFMQVAAGALVALFLYSSSLHPLIKWPLIVISFLFGIALAFFPLEDRPLSKWIVLFIKAIYSPTIYVWNNKATKTSYFMPEPEAETAMPLQEVTSQPSPTSQKTQVTPKASLNGLSKLDESEQEFLSKVNKHFSTPSFDIKGNIVPQPKIIKQVDIPIKTPTRVEAVNKAETVPTVPETIPLTQTGNLVTPSRGQIPMSTQTVTFSLEAAPPSPPTKPNVIVGQVLDPNGKIIENAILEIKDAEGRPVRALKSNKLGHFMIVTPLSDGRYEILTEKEGYTFATLSFEAKDTIIPPIAIWAKNSDVKLN